MPGHSFSIDARQRNRRAEKAIDLPPTCAVEALVEYPPLLLGQVDRLSQAMPDTLAVQQRRWLALQLLEGDIYSSTRASNALKILPEVQETLKRTLNEDPALIIADSRYKSITDICDSVSNTATALPNILTENWTASFLTDGWEYLFSAGDVCDVRSGDQHRWRTSAAV